MSKRVLAVGKVSPAGRYKTVRLRKTRHLARTIQGGTGVVTTGRIVRLRDVR